MSQEKNTLKKTLKNYFLKLTHKAGGTQLSRFTRQAKRKMENPISHSKVKCRHKAGTGGRMSKRSNNGTMMV